MVNEQSEKALDKEQAGQDVPQAQTQEQPQSAGAPSEFSTEDYQDLHQRYLRLAADFDNFRKRQAQEREHLFKYGAQNTLEQLLPVLDNLERAQQSLNESSDPKMLYKSFEMLSQQLLNALQDVGLSRMSPQGDAFDPERHEAISQVPDATQPEHTILQVYQDGYSLHDRVLRPAKVVVSVQPEAAADAPDSSFQPVGDTRSNPFQAQPGSERHAE